MLTGVLTGADGRADGAWLRADGAWLRAHGDGQRRLVWLPMAAVARWRGHALVAMETGLLRWRGHGRRADTV